MEIQSEILVHLKDTSKILNTRQTHQDLHGVFELSFVHSIISAHHIAAAGGNSEWRINATLKAAKIVYTCFVRIQKGT